MREKVFQVFIPMLLLGLGTWGILTFYGENFWLILSLLLCSFLFGLYMNINRLTHNPVSTKKSQNIHSITVDLVNETALLYDSLFKNNSDGIIVSDTNGNVVDGNPVICKMSGYTLEEFKNIELSSFICEDDLDKKFQHTKKALEGSPQEFNIHVQNRIGKKLLVMVKMIPIKVDEEIVGLFEIIKDITESKKLEEMMYHSDKMNAIGQLAAGVAHEIRNPLTSLKGFIQLSKSELSGEYVKIMELELERINQIVGEFLFLSKPQKVSFVFQNIGVILTDVVQFIKPEALLNKVEIHTTIDRDLPQVHCEENQLKQVFINLLKNSMEAMPSGGNIFITVSNNVDILSIKIKDEGVGIPKEILEKIGQPFFTTKQSGNGLGILVTYRIIESHGGTFSITSEENVGTEVEISLPISDDSSTQLAGNTLEIAQRNN
ncbi:ATP-binding protein [Evansella tamaricis]|uniref:PAS domain S-box protein n=1 Tax=Evansella tamaricis TaxID=2069301 RepID=A0ABS6JGK8_9BACI|nr:ATP-binding protein [Evansella tamaricis]MBU9712736.1 PAS domain S-box protein [Evansella tamaricis]